MQRHDNWPERLADFIETRRDTPFAWGVNDCAGFAFHAVEAITGVDPIASLRRYKTPLGAARILTREGGMRALVTARLGEPVGAASAQRGDVVLVQIDGRDTLVVCTGDRLAGPGVDGLVLLPLSAGLVAWRV